MQSTRCLLGRVELEAQGEIGEMESLTLNDGGRLPVLGLGTWQMGGGRSRDYSRDDEMAAIVRDAIAMGYTHIDTAEMYGVGHCEELVGRAMQDFAREDIFLTTKVLADNVRYDDLLRALDGSLERLQTEYADMYLIHWPNPSVPLEETFRALNRVVAEGRVKRVGVSNFDVALFREAEELCETPVVTNQVRYNLYTREPEENGLLRYCQENNVVLTAYCPLKDGVMQNETVQAVARKHGASAAQVAIRWLTRQPQVVTIPMSTNRDHLRQNMEALTLALDEEDVQRLDASG